MRNFPLSNKAQVGNRREQWLRKKGSVFPTETQGAFHHIDRERASHLLGNLWSLYSRHSPANLLLLYWPESFFWCNGELGDASSLELLVPCCFLSCWGTLHQAALPLLPLGSLRELKSDKYQIKLYFFFNLQHQRVEASVLIWLGCFAVRLRLGSPHGNSQEDSSSFSKCSVPNSIFALQPLWISRTSKNAAIASDTVAAYNQILCLYALLIFLSQKGIHECGDSVKLQPS